MGCGSCATGSCGSVTAAPAGCNNNGSCGTGGCNKLNSFDWLGNMSLPASQSFNIIEVKFKGGKKEFFRNEDNLPLVTGDAVVCEMQSGYHVGHVSLQGELVRLQMKKKKVVDDEKIKKIYRLANERDLDKLEQVKKRELPTMFRTREIVKELKISMKLSDVEFQADNSKATFYYSADERVDFRELIKVIASEFKIRVEMRQISLRQEASRIGGIGSCGRELCCSTWLTDFKSVTTGAARYQNLSLNPTKLSGQCGRLKCCLNYELETYLDALLDIPKVNKPLAFTKGDAQLQKVDIFKKILWFSFENESNWFALEAHYVKEVIELNKQGKKAEVDEDLFIPASSSNNKSESSGTEQPLLGDDLGRFADNRRNDKPSKRRKKRRKKKPNTPNAPHAAQSKQSDGQDGTNKSKPSTKGTPKANRGESGEAAQQPKPNDDRKPQGNRKKRNNRNRNRRNRNKDT